MPNRKEIGKAEPGFEAFARYYTRGGTSDKTIEQYAEFLGTVRALSDKPLLELDVDGLERLDERLLTKAKVYRAILRMFYLANKRYDLREALPRQHRPKTRRLSMDDVLMPVDVTALVKAASNLRDRALISALYSSGGRINELLELRIRHIKKPNGGYQFWFGETKTRGQERYSPKIEKVWKGHLDKWLSAHPHRANPNAWLFPSTNDDGNASGVHVNAKTINKMLHGLKEKIGLSKRTNAHWFRHSRISFAFATKEADIATISTWFWGVPVTPMANRYCHFRGLEMEVEAVKSVELPPVPALPTPPILATQKHVAELEMKIAQVRQEVRKELLEEITTAMRSEFERYAREKNGIIATNEEERKEAIAQVAQGKKDFIVSVTKLKE